MRIKTKLSQNRRDFYAIYECEHCLATNEGGGYDDAFYHEKVIPNMTCLKCKKTSKGVVSSSASVPAYEVM